MRVLVTWASKRGGTEGIADSLGEALRRVGMDVMLVPAQAVRKDTAFDAALIGGALYAGRWPAAARRLIRRHEKRFRQVPVWLFSSGPLDDSADRQNIPPTRQVHILMDRVGAQGHRTFGGRLSPDAKGFPARAMAKDRAGDWRNQDRIRSWACEIARELPTARPRVPTTPPGGSLVRLALHAVAGWALCAATMEVLLGITHPQTAFIGHAIATPFIFTVVAWHYFREVGARDPLPTATSFVFAAALLDLIVARIVQHNLKMFESLVGTWLPLGLAFLLTWGVGSVMSMIPSARDKEGAKEGIPIQ
jgi:menaquinone-dependent protoporphyrinogen oxidase